MQSKSRWIARRGLLRIVALALGRCAGAGRGARRELGGDLDHETRRRGDCRPAADVRRDDRRVARAGERGHPRRLDGRRPEAETLGTLELREEGSWSLTAANPLAEGEYTAVAEQPLDPREGTAERHFSVSTEPPTVTIKGPSSPTSDTV